MIKPIAKADEVAEAKHRPGLAWRRQLYAQVRRIKQALSGRPSGTGRSGAPLFVSHRSFLSRRQWLAYVSSNAETLCSEKHLALRAVLFEMHGDAEGKESAPVQAHPANDAETAHKWKRYRRIKQTRKRLCNRTEH